MCVCMYGDDHDEHGHNEQRAAVTTQVVMQIVILIVLRKAVEVIPVQ